jgi:hypothetical protein
LIADSANNCTRRITPVGHITTVKGSTGILSPEYIVVTRDGALDVAAQDANRIYHITPDGQQTIIAGTGKRGFSGDGGPARSAKLSGPYGLALDNKEPLRLGNHRQPRPRSIHTASSKPSSEQDTGLPRQHRPRTHAQLKPLRNRHRHPRQPLHRRRRQQPRPQGRQHGIITTIAGNH